MKVELLYNTPLWVCSTAIRKCWASEDKSDTELCYGGDWITGTKDKELIHRVGNKNKHSSTLEHLVYTFDIDGISRACLQELARHRHASMSVKSTRYTLKELRDAPQDGTVDFRKFVVMTTDSKTNEHILKSLSYLKENLENNTSNDISKYMLPEAYKTSLVWTVNARSLQNFLQLRTNPSALWEIRDLANELFNKLPDEHKYLFEEYVYEGSK